MASELVRQLVDSGIHFGHRVSRWNPKMSPYIFGKRNTIHIIDIRETVRGLLRAKKFIAQVVAKGDDVLFVGDSLDDDVYGPAIVGIQTIWVNRKNLKYDAAQIRPT